MYSLKLFPQEKRTLIENTTQLLEYRILRFFNFTLVLFFLSAQSKDDLAISLTPKKSKKDKGLFALFRSSSDPDLTCEMKNGTLFGKKHKDEFPPPREVMGNGVHHSIPEEVIKEKGEIEETKEKRKERKEKEKGEDRGGRREKTSKKDREEDREKLEKKERRREKEREKERDKEKKSSRRDEKDGSEADCSICQEKIRKSREKSHSKESRHKDKEHRSKSEHKRSKDYYEDDGKDRKQKGVDRQDEEKEHHRRKKHHHDREKERDKSRKDRHHQDKHHHKRRSDEQMTANEVSDIEFLLSVLI